MNLKPFMPVKARHHSRKERWRFLMIGLGSLYEGLVITLSLGYLNVNTRSWMLFDLFEDD